MTSNDQAFWQVVTSSYPDTIPPTSAEAVHREVSRDELPDADNPSDLMSSSRMLRDSVHEATRGIIFLVASGAVLWAAAGILYSFLIR